MNLEPGQRVLLGLDIPTEFERRLREPRRSEPFDVFGDGLTACYENIFTSDSAVVVLDCAGAEVFRASREFWYGLVEPLISRPAPGELLEALAKEIAVVLKPKDNWDFPRPTNRHERRAAASRARSRAR